MEDGRDGKIGTKWEERFRSEGFILGTDPSTFLKGNMPFIKSVVPGIRALDIACGEGRNSIFLAREGFSVTGLDLSPTGLEKAARWAEREGLAIDFRSADLETYLFTDCFDLIVNVNFLLRDLIQKSVAALNPGGVMVFDTLLDSPFVPTPHKKEFLLRPGELLSIFSGFPGTIHRHEERLHDDVPTAKLIFSKA